MTENRRLPPRVRSHFSQRHSLAIAMACAPWRRSGMTLAQMADRLNDLDVKMFAGRPWNWGRLSQVLRQGRAAALEEYTRTGDHHYLVAATTRKKG